MKEDDLRLTVCNFLEQQGLELVEWKSRSESGSLVLRLLVDKPEGGISMDECAGANRAICAMLDQGQSLAGAYSLEVFSPGLDRPLSTQADFSRNLGKKAKFFLKQQINGKIEWDGTINNVSESHVDVGTDKGDLQIPLSVINKAKLLFN